MPRKQPRREFLETLGLTAAGALAAGYTSTARAAGPNDTIGIGCIGTGGRCRRLMSKLAERVPGVKLVAVCDVWDHHLDLARKIADPKAFATKDYHQLLDRQDVDAVLIGSPDHWHVPMTIDAVAAGKDVYVEKPLTHDLSEGKAVIEAVRNCDRVVQVGMQQRSMPQMMKGHELIEGGVTGDVHKVHLTWNRNSPRGQKRKYGIDPKTVDWKRFLGNAPDQPFDEYRFRNWRWFWDFGGGIFTDLMVHFIDVANWFLELGTPAQVASIGDHFMAEGVWETPDTVQTLLRFPEQEVQVYFEGTFVNARNAAMLEFMGTKATVYLDRGRMELHPERRSGVEPQEMILGEGPRGADFYSNPDGEMLHLVNWVECMRARREPNAPVETGVAAAALAHYSNQALRSGKTLRPDG